MSRTFSWLAPYETNLPEVFQEYLDKMRDLPIGSERLHWNREILRQKDLEIEIQSAISRSYFRSELGSGRPLWRFEAS
jgi:hypothetical protein